MRAIVIDRTGGPDVLQLRDVPVPEPAPTEVRVRVAYAGVNFIDTYHRTGLYPVELPFVPGVEAAGVVDAVGAEVTSTAPGARVAWTGPPGGYAELALVPEDRLVPVPDDLTLADAAAVMLQGMTAHYLTRDTYPVSRGEQVLIHAGAGGTGRLAIQFAVEAGATVFTTVGSAEKARVAADAGAHHVIRYDEGDFGEAVETIAGPHALHVVYDGVGAATFERGLDLLRIRGMMVAFGNASGPAPPIDPLVLSQKGSLYLTRPSLFHYIATREELLRRAGDVFAGLREGWLTVLIGARFPLEDARSAHEALEGRRTVGKVLLEVAPDLDR